MNDGCSILKKEYVFTKRQFVYLFHRVNARAHHEKQKAERLEREQADEKKIASQRALVATLGAIVEKMKVRKYKGEFVLWLFEPDDHHQVFQLRRTLLNDMRRLEYLEDDVGLKLNVSLQNLVDPQFSDAQIFFSYV